MRRKLDFFDLLVEMGKADVASLPRGVSPSSSLFAESVNDVVSSGMSWISENYSEQIQKILLRLAPFRIRNLGSAELDKALQVGVASHLQLRAEIKNNYFTENLIDQSDLKKIPSTKEYNVARKRVKNAVAELLEALENLSFQDRLLLGVLRLPPSESRQVAKLRADPELVFSPFKEKPHFQAIEILEAFSALVERVCSPLKGSVGKPYSPNELGRQIESLACLWFVLTGERPDLKTNRGSFGHFLDEFLPDVFRAANHEERKPAIRALVHHAKRHPRFFTPFDTIPPAR